MSESLINIKMWFNYIVEYKADMSNFVDHKNNLGARRASTGLDKYTSVTSNQKNSIFYGWNSC